MRAARSRGARDPRSQDPAGERGRSHFAARDARARRPHPRSWAQSRSPMPSSTTPPPLPPVLAEIAPRISRRAATTPPRAWRRRCAARLHRRRRGLDPVRRRAYARNLVARGADGSCACSAIARADEPRSTPTARVRVPRRARQREGDDPGRRDRVWAPGDVIEERRPRPRPPGRQRGRRRLLSLHAYSPPLPVDAPSPRTGRSVVIVGGGLSGVAVAMHLLRRRRSRPARRARRARAPGSGAASRTASTARSSASTCRPRR